MLSFDANSLDLLNRCVPQLRAVLMVAIGRTPFAWRIVQSDRTIEQQQEYFNAGRSKINPAAYTDKAKLFADAKHITGPGAPLARAVDVAITGKDPYNVPALCYLAGVIRSCAIQQGVTIRWGGDFDQDGMLLEVGTFMDLPHFEIA